MSDPYDPYDPYVPNVQSVAATQQKNEKVNKVKAQVDAVVDVMKDNIEMAKNRGVKLEDISKQTEKLEKDASNFRRSGNEVRKRMWWKDLKWKIIIALTILIILGVIIASIVVTQTKA
ncbi:synaptobrevin-domain-containing protein [Phycomyces blakesleeanus]|uniref:Synaptobrevin-domain-containing protein n=1 Tax=Phycomyces blakesleeanus TaxID=4837 RepID=A0ABR3B9U9_PHYBL